MQTEIRREKVNPTSFFKLFGILFILFYGAVALMHNFGFKQPDRITFVLYSVALPFFIAFIFSYINRRAHMAISGNFDKEIFQKRIKHYLIDNGDYYISTGNKDVYIRNKHKWRRILEDIDVTVSKVQNFIILSGPPSEIYGIERWIEEGGTLEELN